MKYRSFIKKSPLSSEMKKIEKYLGKTSAQLGFGWGNGYVAFQKPHPFYGLGYDEINYFIQVFGGLTYSEPLKEMPNLSFSDDDMWCVGFDTAHSGGGHYKIEDVQAKTDLLLIQLAIHGIKGAT